jgi:hypothetical protein
LASSPVADTNTPHESSTTMVLSLGMHEAGGPLSSPPVPLDDEDELLDELLELSNFLHPSCG